MKLCIISDTHLKHKFLKLPDADLIIHCGDGTSMGKEHEVHDFFKWYASLGQYKYKIFIAGNHDFLFERNRSLALSHKSANIIYLEDSGVEIEGIKFWGTPVQKIFYNWAFNRAEDVLEKYWQIIPNDTDVLITHSPPFMIGDYVWRSGNQGSPSLRKEVLERIKPKIHCFGHIHEGYGINKIDDTIFINASNLDENYNCINDPILIEI